MASLSLSLSLCVCVCVCVSVCARIYLVPTCSLTRTNISRVSRWVYAMVPSLFMGGVNTTASGNTITHHPHNAVWMQVGSSSSKPWLGSTHSRTAWNLNCCGFCVSYGCFHSSAATLATPDLSIWMGPGE
eukprot:COSAG05_NODE_4024_length_1712_cov_25.190329_3_plen_130_part_00